MSAGPLRIALVTGGHSRVGRAISEALAARGWRVLLHAFRGTARAEALDQQLNPPPHGPMGVWQADFSDTAATLASFETLLATLPAEAELALVHNASAFENDDRDSVTLDRFRLHHAVHYEVPVLLTLAAAQRFPRGQALMVLDQNVENLHDQFLSYCLSKGAMHAAMKRLALALKTRMQAGLDSSDGSLSSSSVSGGRGVCMVMIQFLRQWWHRSSSPQR